MQLIVHILVSYLIVVQSICATLFQDKGTKSVFCGEWQKNAVLILILFLFYRDYLYLSLTSFLSHRHGNYSFSSPFIFNLPQKAYLHGTGGGEYCFREVSQTSLLSPLLPNVFQALYNFFIQKKKKLDLRFNKFPLLTQETKQVARAVGRNDISCREISQGPFQKCGPGAGEEGAVGMKRRTSIAENLLEHSLIHSTRWQMTSNLLHEKECRRE